MELRSNIIYDVIEFYEENRGEHLTRQDVEDLDIYDILDAYLQWNGIIGYTCYIINIFYFFSEKSVR